MPTKPKPAPLQLTPQQLAKVAASKARHEGSSLKIDGEDMFVAEFGYYYGWNGVMAILNNHISYKDAVTLLVGARKVWAGKVIDSAVATAVGEAMSKSKNPGETLRKGMKSYLKEAKVDA